MRWMYNLFNVLFTLVSSELKRKLFQLFEDVSIPTINNGVSEIRINESNMEQYGNDNEYLGFLNICYYLSLSTLSIKHFCNNIRTLTICGNSNLKSLNIDEAFCNVIKLVIKGNLLIPDSN